MKIAIQAEALTRRFGAVPAVDNLSLQVPAGIIFGYLGPNGAGKTTTIHLLLGLLEPSSGRAEVMGYDTRSQSDEIRRTSGALLEHTGLYERLSAEDNLELYGRIYRMSASKRSARIEELLSHLNLWDRRGEIIATWSNGMKKKLAVARTLLHAPSVVFLDEPTAGLDPVAAAAVREDLAELASQDGTTVFLTTHNLSEAEMLCQLVGVIHEGKLLVVGPPEELKRSNANQRLRIIGDGFDESVLELLRNTPQVSKVLAGDGSLEIDLHDGSDSAPLISLIVEAGGRIQEVHKEIVSLEQVFLRLIEEGKQ